ncbi:MAG: hypothetical protein R2710_19435 [Acidimicrobiales bacterium]
MAHCEDLERLLDLVEDGDGSRRVPPESEHRRRQVEVGEPAAIELQFLDQRHRPHHRVVTVAQVDLGPDGVVGAGAPTNGVAGLDHEHPAAGSGQIGTTDETVVAATDDDRIEVIGTIDGDFGHGRTSAAVVCEALSCVSVTG